MPDFNAGTAFVPVVPNAAGFLSSLQRQISPALSAIKAQGISSGAAIGAAFVAAGVLAAKGLQSAVRATEEWAASVRSVQRVTGLAAEEASGLTFAARSLNIETDKLTVGLGLLAKNIVNNTTNFAKYGIATRDAQGNQLGLIDILGNVSDKYEQLGGGIQGAALAMNVFGRSGKNLIPILSRGSEGLQEMFDQAQAFGLVLSQDALDASKALGIAQRQLALSFEGFKVQVGEALIPVLITFVGVLTDIVGVLHLIPGPVVDVAAGFLVLSGALVAIKALGGVIATAWAPLVGLFTGTAAAAGLEAEATSLQVDASAALLAELPELIAALQVLAGVEGEVAVAAGAAAKSIGFQASASGLLVPESAAIAATGPAATKGASGFSALAASLNPVVLGIGAVAAGFVLYKIAVDGAHRAFEAGVQKDFIALTQGSKQAANAVKSLAAQTAEFRAQAQAARFAAHPEAPQLGSANVIAFQASASAQASEALRRLREFQDALGSSAGELNTQIAASVRSLLNMGDQAVLGSADIGKLNVEIGRTANTVDGFVRLTGVDATSVLGTFQQAVADAAGSLPKLQAASAAAVGQARALWAQWHDSIVQAFGGAGSALDAFADKTNVDLGRATGKLTQYTRQIGAFGDNIKTISDEFGKKASAFIEFATSQGLAQAGLVNSVADASKKNAAAFVSAFNTGGRATDDLATQIQNTLGKAFDAMISKLGAIKRALTGQPPLKVDTSQATNALDALNTKLHNLVTTDWTASIRLGVHGDFPVVPGFAQGFHGTVTRPTLFVAGEAGAERVDVGPGGGSGASRFSGRAQMVDWHRGILDLQGELDHADLVSA